jgi:hypothetical protein
MELALTRDKLISLLLNELLGGNYDCIILIVKIKNQLEINDSINYHIQQSSIRENNKFSTYSFLYMIHGFDFDSLKIQKKAKKEVKDQQKILLEKEKNFRRKDGALSYYDTMLSNQNLPRDQRKLFMKMKQKRLNRLQQEGYDDY